MKIGIIIGSIREGRKGEAIANWIHEAAKSRAKGFNYEVLDLKGFNVPLLSSATVPGAANKKYDDANVTAWSKAIDGCAGFIFVTPEYNHSVPGPLKNAFDSLGSEWAGKVVAFAGYGAAGGVRAVEHWRQIVSNFQMHDVRNQLELSIFADADENGFAPGDRRSGELDTVLNDLEALITQLNK